MRNGLNEMEKLNLDKYQHNGIVTNNPNFNYKNMTLSLSEIKYFVLPQYYHLSNNGKTYNLWISQLDIIV